MHYPTDTSPDYPDTDNRSERTYYAESQESMSDLVSTNFTINRDSSLMSMTSTMALLLPRAQLEKRTMSRKERKLAQHDIYDESWKDSWDVWAVTEDDPEIRKKLEEEKKQVCAV